MTFTFCYGDCDDRRYVFEVLFARAPTEDERLSLASTFEADLAAAGARQAHEPWLWFDAWAIVPVEYEDRAWFRDGIHGQFTALHALVPLVQVVLLNAQDDGDGLAAPAGLVVGPKWDRWMWSDYSRGVFTRHAPRKGVPKVAATVDPAVEAWRTAPE